MAIKKSDIYRSLWDSCDQLRGGMDASLYKDYILTLLFVKYVSDRAGKHDALIEVPAGCSFEDLKKLRGTKEIGEGIDKAIAGIAEANDLKNVIDRAYFNDSEKFGRGQKMVTTLTALINIFSREELNFARNRADGDDILGDAYEYLMRNFATESGKSKGQFYTPAEVSRVVAAVAGINRATSPRQTVYDPTCGSGSLLFWARRSASRPHLARPSTRRPHRLRRRCRQGADRSQRVIGGRPGRDGVGQRAHFPELGQARRRQWGAHPPGTAKGLGGQ